MNESIYRLIPEPYIPEPRPPRHISKHGSDNAPSYSTFPKKVNPFGHDTTGCTLYARPGATMGRDAGKDINPKQFLKSGDGHPVLPEPQKFSYKEQASKPAVPKRDEKPVMGLVTEKNFVTANAVEAVISVPKNVRAEQPRAVDRPTFAKVPKYLQSVKEQLEMEQQAVEMARTEQRRREDAAMSSYVHQMTDDEREGLIAQLKERWEEKHKQYQALPFAHDTAVQVARKERLENEMKEIEDALSKLNKKVIFVYEDSEKRMAMYTRQIAAKEAQRKAKTAS